ncbi:MAG: carboxypeptidase-like regulatory domain-containing protein, partial [Chitinophagaceae bacterium]|nr:carboxypeptidase-like regulatory domain-containing protein [Chitinophagaceae bacterium]
MLLSFLAFTLHAQTLQGKVLDREGLKPVPNATLFLSNTMVSTTTRDDGSFFFPNIPSGRYELIISCTGYKTGRIEIISSSLPQNLIIQLEPYIKELNEVVVKNYEKDGWNKWGRIFTEQFIG